MRLCKCTDPAGACFARTPKGGCRILTNLTTSGEKCSFKKPDRQYTKGIFYADKHDIDQDTEGETDAE